MRLVRVALVAATMMAIAFACDPFNADGGDAAEDPDGGPGGTSTSSTSSSSSGAPADASLSDAGAGATQCFDFRGSNTNDFEKRGTATPTTDGYKVVVNSSSTLNSIRKTFTLDGGITTSKVGFDVTSEASKPFENDEYADVLTLYYGTPANFGAAPETALTQFEAVAGQDIDVNMWNQAGGGGYTYFGLKQSQVSFAATGDLVWVETHWPAPGQHVVSSGTQRVPIDASLSLTSKSELTVEIGGRRSDEGDPPALTLTLRRLCVEIH